MAGVEKVVQRQVRDMQCDLEDRDCSDAEDDVFLDSLMDVDEEDQHEQQLEVDGKNKFQCQFCSKGYKSKGSLTKHTHKEHGKENVDTSGQKEKKGTRSPQCTVEMLDGSSILQGCLKDIVEDPINTLSERGEMVSEIAKQLLHMKETEEFSSFSAYLVNELWQVLVSGDTKSMLSSARVAMLSNFHSFRLRDSVKQKFRDLLSAFNIDLTDDLLLQNIITKFLESMSSHRDVVDAPVYFGPANKPQEKMTPEEEKTLRYVAGYVPFSLAKRFQKSPSLHHQNCLPILSSWSKSTGKGENFLEYTREWTEKVNRGGVFEVNNDVYIFFRRVEMVVRSMFNIKFLKANCHMPVGKIILSNLLSSKIVQIAWSAITRDVEEECHSTLLFHCVLKKYVAIRGSAFTRVWKKRLDAMKRVSHKGEKSLRKGLGSQITK